MAGSVSLVFSLLSVFIYIFFWELSRAGNVLKVFLNYMVYTTCISVNKCGREQKTCQSALSVEIWYQELLNMTNRDVCHRCYCYTKHALKYFG